MKPGLLAKAHGLTPKASKLKPASVWLSSAGARLLTLSVQVTPSLNQLTRMHWHRRVRMQAQMVCEIQGELGALSVERRQGKVNATITRYSPGELDYDNLVGGCKPLVDTLVAVGLVWDDSPEWLVVDYRQTKCKRSEARTEVVFT